MATLGAALTTPESGWRRIDNLDSKIKYKGTWTPVADGNRFLGEMRYAPQKGAAFAFNFTGPQVRLIGQKDATSVPDATVFIDGKKHGTMNQYAASGIVYQALSYGVTGLTDTEHSICVVHNNLAGGNMVLDAVDIASAGVLKIYNPWLDPSKTKTQVSLMVPGDRIKCRYTNTAAGVVGAFSELGTTTIGEMGESPATIVDGAFYFIMVGYDWKGRRKLLADRNIQSTISWDTLNTAGFCSLNGIPIPIDGNSKSFSIRLPGSNNQLYVDPMGVWPNHDDFGEWDHIFYAPSITIDPFLWNQSTHWVWTLSTAEQANTSYRYLRGNINTGNMVCESWGYPNTADATVAFRPMLVVDPSNINIDLVIPTHIYEYQHGGVILQATSKDINGNAGQYKIAINGTDVSPMSADVARTLPMSTFTVGANNVVVTGDDGAYNFCTVIREEPFRTIAKRTFLPYDGGYSLFNAKLDKAVKAVDTSQVGLLKTTSATNVMLTGYSGITSVKASGTGKLAVSFNGGITWQAYSCGIDEFVSSYMNFNSGIVDFTGKFWTGTATVEAGAGKFGSSAAKFNGTGSVMTTPVHDDFRFNDKDFTVDFFVKFTDLSAGAKMFSIAGSSGYSEVSICTVGSGSATNLWGLASKNNTAWDCDVRGTTPLVINQWYHVALLRYNDVLYLTVDGDIVAQVPLVGSLTPTISAISLGVDLKGYIDEFRVSKGIARWNGAFTPPGTTQTAGYWGPVTESDIMTTGMPPVVMNMLTGPEWKTVFQKTNLDFMIGVTGNQAIAGINVVLPNNQPPKASNLKLTPGLVHSGIAHFEADIIDEEEQECWYRMSVDNTPVTDWIKFNRMVHVNQPIQINTYSLGLHSIKLECKDVLNAMSDYSINFTKVNSDPYCTVSWDSKHMSAIIGDADSDYIQYRLIINGVTKIDWTGWFPAGYEMTYRFRRRELAIGQLNQVRLEYRDVLGGKGSWTQNIVGTYNNLMFMDTFGAYYSDDTGITIQILDLGTLIAGSGVGPVEVRIKNETGWPVKNIKVFTANPYLPEVRVELSHTLSPFTPVDPWVVPTVLADGDQIPVFLQLTSVDTAYRGGDFKLHVVGELVLDSEFATIPVV